MKKIKVDLIRWLTGIGFAGIGMLTAVMKYVH